MKRAVKESEVEEDLKAACLTIAKHLVESGHGGAVGIIIPATEFNGETRGPFNLRIEFVNQGDAPLAAICARVGSLGDEDNMAHGTCVLCFSEVVFETTAPDVQKVCVACFVEIGPDDLEDALNAERQ